MKKIQRPYTLTTITDTCLGAFLISRDIFEDSAGQIISATQTYLIQLHEETQKYIIRKSYVLSEANQN